MKNALLIVLFALSVPTLATNEKHASKLDAILEKQEESVSSRYDARNPKETLTFFDIEPGMTVLEALPGGGWYSKILMEYLGSEGKLFGVDYALEMWKLFSWVGEDFLNDRKTWSHDWPKIADEWNVPNAAKTSAYSFDTLPKELENSVDVAFFVRALHNLYRFESQGNYFTNALDQTFKALKPGGIVGVVQHETVDKQADGSQGYMHKATLIKSFENAGFEFVGETDINQNPKDKADGIVWRLPPTFALTQEQDAKHKEYAEIGESNRMTLKFRKPLK